MIVKDVIAAQKKAEKEGHSSAPLLKMLTAQFKMITHSRKSGDDLPDDKAINIIERMISGLEENKALNLGNIDIEANCDRKIEILRGFLPNDSSDSNGSDSSEENN